MSISSIGPAGTTYSANYDGGIKKISVITKYEDLSPEQKAEWERSNAHVAEVARIGKEMEEAAKLQSTEVHDRVAPNVSTLTKEQALQQIESMTELIQSGQDEETKLWTGYGDKTTNNYRQYVYWLKEHVKQLDGAQAGTDVKA